MLPGGLLHNGQLERRFSLKPITGYTEMAFFETENQRTSLPDRISEILTVCIDRIGDHEADRQMMETLSTGDRQYLMRQIAANMGFDNLWLTSNCNNCSEPFDINIQLSQLPVKTAGKNYPFVLVNTGGFKIKLRVPTGSDQKKVVKTAGNDAEGLLFESILVEVEGHTNDSFLNFLTPDLITKIEMEVEKASPEVAVLINTYCPDCSAENHVSVDPYICLKLVGKDIYSQIHKLATWYHWSEDQILSLTKSRRHIYLDLIDKHS